MKKIFLFCAGMILLSMTSFAQTWISQGLGFTTASRGMMNICIVDAQTVWVSAYDGSGGGAAVQDFSKTLNGGTLWTAGTISGATSGLQTSMLWATSGTTAYAAMYKSSGSNAQGVFKTTDGGATWTRQTTATFSNASSFPDWIYFFDANTGVVLGDPINGDFEIYTTTNGGTTWTAVPGSQIPNPISGEYGYTSNVCAYGDNIWFGTNKGRVFASTDKGHNWVVAAPYATTKNVLPAYKDASNGLALKYQATTDTTGLLKASADGGVTYTTKTYTGPAFAGDIKFVPGSGNTYITTGVDATNQSDRLGVCYSFDGGSSWTPDADILGNQITSQDWMNDSVGWVGSFNTDITDGIFKFNGVLAPPAIPVANFMSADTLLPLGGSATFVNESTGSPTSYLWTFSNGTPSSSTLQTPPAITYNVPGQHDVKLVATNANGSNTLIKTGYIHVGGVGVNELNANEISIYPNPVKDAMTVKSDKNIKDVQIYNAGGQLIISQQVNAKTVTINTSGLTSGIYNLKATLDNGTISKKVVIQ